jgi:hypothetical protein
MIHIVKKITKILDTRLFHLFVISILSVDILLLLVEHIILIVRVQHLSNICKPDTLLEAEIIEEPLWMFYTEKITHWFSFGIVCFLVLELILKLLVHQLSYFKKVLNTLDAFLIVFAFLAEFFLPLVSDGLTIALLLPIRVMRLVRLTITALEVDHERRHLKNHSRIGVGETIIVETN